MIDLAILGLLDEQDLHGYELKKQLAELVGARSGISFGSLYPALRRLERAGAIEAVDESATAPTPTGTHVPTGSLKGDLAAARMRLRAHPSRRTRRAYGITDLGRAMFAELLTDESDDDEREFAVKLLFCGHLDPAVGGLVVSLDGQQRRPRRRIHLVGPLDAARDAHRRRMGQERQ